MSSRQKCILLTLLGLMLVSIAILKKSWFAIWQPTVYLLPVFLLGGIVLMSVFGGRLTGIKPVVPLLLLALMEFCLALELKRVGTCQNVGLVPKAVLQDLFQNELRSIPFLTSTSGRYNEDFFYTLRPGVSTFSNLEYSNKLHIHPSGFRAKEEDFLKGEIVFLGDSFTMGWGVEAEESFPKVVEKISGIKTLDLGMPSFGTARELMAWNKYRPQNPKLVVWQFCANDTSENSAYVHNDFKLDISPRWTYEAARRRNELQQYYYPLKYVSSLFRCEIRQWFGTGMEASTESCIRQFFTIVGKVRAHYNGPIVIMDLESSNPSGYWFEEMNDFLRENPMDGIFLFPVNDLLSEKDYYLMDDHLNSYGHRKVAEALWEYVLSNDILPPASQELSRHL